MRGQTYRYLYNDGGGQHHKKEALGIVTDDFISGIRDIALNFKMYRGKAEQARQWVRQNLSWPLFAKKMLRVFEDTSTAIQKKEP